MTGKMRPPSIEPGLTTPPGKPKASLEGYGPQTRSDPLAFLASVRKEYPDLKQLLDARDLKATQQIVRQIDRSLHQAIMGLLIATEFQLGKIGKYDEHLAAARARVELTRLYDESTLDCFFENSQPRNLGDALTELGSCFEQFGQFDIAMRTFKDADACYEANERLLASAGRTQPSKVDVIFGWHDFRSQLYVRMSELQKRLGDSEEAARYNLLAWRFSKRGSSPEDRFEKEISQGAGARERGDLDKALGAYWRALDLALTLQSSQLSGKDVVEALANVARIHADLGLHRTAITHFKRCIELNTFSTHRGRLLIDYRSLAKSFMALKQTEAALEALNEALRLCSIEIAPGQGRPPGLGWHDSEKQYLLTRQDTAWKVLLERARMRAPTDPVAAISDLEWAVSIVERLRKRVLSEGRRIGSQQDMIGVYDELIRLHADRYAATGDAGSAQAIFLNIERAKSRVLAEMMSERTLPPPPLAPPGLIADEQALLATAARLEDELERGEGDPLAASEELSVTVETLDRVWNQIAADVPSGGLEYVALRRADPIGAEEIAALLREAGGNVNLVNYYLLPDRLLIVVLKPGVEHPHVIQRPVARKAVQDLVAVDPANPPPPDRRLDYWTLDLGPLLTEPLNGVIPRGEGICFVPHDALHALPLHALPAGVGAAPLIEGASVSYTPSASVLRFILRRPRSSSKECLVVGAPIRIDQVPIENTRLEAQAVADALGCKPLVGEAASRQAVEELIPRSHIVHIACHHVFNETAPMQSALLLTGGDLSAQHLLEMDITADLVTLSACQSGVSRQHPGDELVGTIRALIFSGARSVLVSLWNTYDESTSKLMADFYRCQMQSTLSRREALQSAQNSARSRQATTAQWAPFVLVGDWR